MLHSGLVRLCMLIAMIAYSSSGLAKDPVSVNLELDKDYDLESFTEYRFTFVAPESGTFTFKGTSYVPVNVDETFSTPTQNDRHSFVTGGQQRQMSVEKGVTYYYVVTPMDNVTVRATMGSADEKVELVSSKPAAGSEFGIVTGGVASFEFNTPISVGIAKLTSGTNEITVGGFVNSNFLSFALKDYIYEWLKSGAVKKGDDITLSISDIKSVIDETKVYGTDGSLSVTWKAPALPTVLEQETAPAVFKS